MLDSGKRRQRKTHPQAVLARYSHALLMGHTFHAE
jgi:hypothetical protein